MSENPVRDDRPPPTGHLPVHTTAAERAPRAQLAAEHLPTTPTTPPSSASPGRTPPLGNRPRQHPGQSVSGCTEQLMDIPEPGAGAFHTDEEHHAATPGIETEFAALRCFALKIH
ncbi:hypothetical protein ACIRFH_32790 [Streptomyces sp. NPDC093586]|uniref:hypothetical protein n=1 Tax=Streptomyces sp. NPDC093586 TaxID=3366042 RepID=UPI0038006D48